MHRRQKKTRDTRFPVFIIIIGGGGLQLVAAAACAAPAEGELMGSGGRRSTWTIPAQHSPHWQALESIKLEEGVIPICSEEFVSLSLVVMQFRFLPPSSISPSFFYFY